MKKRSLLCWAVLAAVLALMLSGCRVNLPFGTDFLSGETYPNAEAYQTGAFTYRADDISAVEVYWRSGDVEITESGDSELQVRESGSTLPEETAMHYLLDEGVLRIRFCKSGANVRVNAAEKRLHLEIPAGIDLTVHTTSAIVNADTLNQNSILIAAHSGSTELGSVTADTVHLSSSSGPIRADSILAQTLACSASSGAVEVGTVSVRTLDCSTSSGSVTMDSLAAGTAQIRTSSGSVKLALTDVPAAEIHTSSGAVTLTLAEGGAEVRHTASSGRLLTDRPYERKGDWYVFGEGAGSLTVATSSGNLRIR